MKNFFISGCSRKRCDGRETLGSELKSMDQLHWSRAPPFSGLREDFLPIAMTVMSGTWIKFLREHRAELGCEHNSSFPSQCVRRLRFMKDTLSVTTSRTERRQTAKLKPSWRCYIEIQKSTKTYRMVITAWDTEGHLTTTPSHHISNKQLLANYKKKSFFRLL